MGAPSRRTSRLPASPRRGIPSGSSISLFFPDTCEGLTEHVGLLCAGDPIPIVEDEEGNTRDAERLRFSEIVGNRLAERAAVECAASLVRVQPALGSEHHERLDIED